MLAPSARDPVGRPTAADRERLTAMAQRTWLAGGVIRLARLSRGVRCAVSFVVTLLDILQLKSWDVLGGGLFD